MMNCFFQDKCLLIQINVYQITILSNWRMFIQVLHLLLLVLVVNSFIQIETAYNLTDKDLDNSLVKVIQNSSNIKILPDFDIKTFQLVVTNKQKRKAYDLFNTKYNRIVDILKQTRTIQIQSDIIKSQIRSRYIPRTKVWQFSLEFAIEQHHNFFKQLQFQLFKLGVKNLKDSSKVKYLQDKWISSRVFAAAKLSLQERLNKISNDLEIKFIDQVEIEGCNDFQDKERIEAELETEKLGMLSKREMTKTFCESSNRFIEKDVKMEIIFGIGKKKKGLIFRNSSHHLNTSIPFSKYCAPNNKTVEMNIN